MTMKNFTTVLAALAGLFLLYLGFSYLFAPGATAEGFGVSVWPGDDYPGMLRVKGDRDLGMGLVVIALLLAGQRRALGFALAAMTVSPLADMALVLHDGGPAATAFGVHGAAALMIALTATLLLRERPTPTPTPTTA